MLAHFYEQLKILVAILTLLWSVANNACSVINAAFPIPGPGSRWVSTRKVIAALALSRGFAAMRIEPGSPAASVTNFDLQRQASVNFSDASADRTHIVRTLETVKSAVVQPPEVQP